ncbi:MAG: hypothetical protein V3R81_04935 [Gammaproteobacteria bacterium]
MVRPVIEAGDIQTSTGTGTTGAIATQAYEDGDLMIAFLGIDDDVTANNPSAPSTGPYGESLILTSTGSGGSTGGGPTQGVVAWLGTASRSSSTIDFTWTGSEFWAGRCIRVLAGEFDPVTPLGNTSGYDGNTSDSGSTVITPSWSLAADDGGGAILVHMVVDADALGGTPSGWTLTVNTDHGGLSTAITQRDADSSDSETVSSATYTTDADASSTKGIVIRPAALAPAITDVDGDEDYDDAETSVVITGTRFEASQGTGKVEISDNAVYATGTKIEQTVTGWGDTSITVTGVLSTLAPGALWMWITNDSAERNALGFVVTVHRAKAFGMAASSYIAASGEDTTAQLNAPTAGTFFGGRIQDDENPADTLDPGDGQFFEDEWCIEALAASVDAETYQFRVLVGVSPVDTTTVTPELTIGGGETASGAVTIGKPTTAGVAEIVKPASGAVSIGKPTSTGVSEIIKPASGAVSILKPTSAGVSDHWMTALGAISIGKPVTAGVADIIKMASGTPSIPKPITAGVSDIIKPASGAVSVGKQTSIGVAGNKSTASGAVSVGKQTSAGSGDVKKQASGAVSVGKQTTAGAAVQHEAAQGGGPIPKPTSAGSVGFERSASGTPSIPVPTSGGVSEIVKPASGAVSIGKPTTAGTAALKRDASGAVTIPKPTSTGVSTHWMVASGSPSIPKPTTASVAEIIKLASGAVTIPKPISAGVAIIPGEITGSGDVTVGKQTSGGAGTLERSASGAVSIAKPTSAGNILLKRIASGAPSIPKPIATGVSEIIKPASGAVSIAKPTTAGNVLFERSASGAPSIPLPTSAGVSTTRMIAIGGASITKPVSAGNVGFERSASGASVMPKPQSTGTAAIEGDAPSVNYMMHTGVEISIGL